MKEYVDMWKRAFDFNGVSSRKEFWMAYLFNFLFGIVIFIIQLVSPNTAKVISAVYGLAVILPYISLTIRRLHDINKSGYNILLAFIPLVGAIILLVYLCSDSVRKNNIYKSKRKAV